MRPQRARLRRTALILALVGCLQIVISAPGTARTVVAVEPYDFNGDGYADLAIGVPRDGKRGGGSVNVLYGSAKGLTAKRAQLWHQGVPGIKGKRTEAESFGDSLTSADFDCDGRADLAVGVEDKVAVIFGSRRGLTARDQLLRSGLGYLEGGRPRVEHLAAGDFDGDRCSDLAVAGEGRLAVIKGSRRGLGRGERLVLPRTVVHPDEWYSNIAAGDVTGDGLTDLVLGGADKPQSAMQGVVVVAGSPNGLRVSRAVRIDAPPSPLPSERPFFGWGFGTGLAIGDFDGDRRSDLAIGDPSAGAEEWTDDYGEVWQCPSGGGYCSGALVVVPGGPFGLSGADSQVWTKATFRRDHQSQFGRVLAAGDLDADGRDDLAVSEWDAVTVLHGGATGLQAGAVRRWNAATPGVKGRAHDGDFGCGSIRLLDHGRGHSADLSVGIENHQEWTGAVSVLYGTRSGLTAAGDQLWQQSSRGVPGAARDGDEFGGINTCYVDDG